jgi:hypothetical protein
LHHSQQYLKNPAYQRIIKGFRLHQSQDTRFLVLVQDMKLPITYYPKRLSVVPPTRKKRVGFPTIFCESFPALLICLATKIFPFLNKGVCLINEVL